MHKVGNKAQKEVAGKRTVVSRSLTAVVIVVKDVVDVVDARMTGRMLAVVMWERWCLKMRR